MSAAASRHERPPQRDSHAPRMQHNEKETDPRRLSQRRKEIAYGKNTLGYERYLRMVPKEKRRHPRDHPPTPDPTRKYSKRQFDGIVRAWRRKLHDWDPPKSEQDPGPAVAPMIPTPRRDARADAARSARARPRTAQTRRRRLRAGTCLAVAPSDAPAAKCPVAEPEPARAAAAPADYARSDYHPFRLCSERERSPLFPVGFYCCQQDEN